MANWRKQEKNGGAKLLLLLNMCVIYLSNTKMFILLTRRRRRMNWSNRTSHKPPASIRVFRAVSTPPQRRQQQRRRLRRRKRRRQWPCPAYKERDKKTQPNLASLWVCWFAITPQRREVTFVQRRCYMPNWMSQYIKWRVTSKKLTIRTREWRLNSQMKKPKFAITSIKTVSHYSCYVCIPDFLHLDYSLTLSPPV